MKNTGIVRNLDDLGRITLPKEIRRSFGIAEGDPVEIYVDNGVICLKPYKKSNKCILCGGESHLMEFDGTAICMECVHKVMSALQKRERRK